MKEETKYRNVNRSLIATIENLGLDMYDALKLQQQISIHIELESNFFRSRQETIAFNTLLICASKCFEKKIICSMPQNADSETKMLVKKFGTIKSETTNSTYKVLIGRNPKEENEIQLIFNGWQGGLNQYNPENKYAILKENAMNAPFGAIGSAGLAVYLIFVDHFKIKSKGQFKDQLGYSFWNPFSTDWLNELSSGPNLKYGPKKLWCAGLGHLGQATIWTLSTIPFIESPNILLQDYDVSDESNIATQFLTWQSGLLKTRICAKYLEKKGFNTKIVERKLNRLTFSDIVSDYDVLLTSFDNLTSRRLLERQNLALVIDAGVGSKLDSFDSISITNLTTWNLNGLDLWEENVENIEVPKTIYQQQLEKKFGCGKIFSTGIATPFVGLLTSCFAVSEVFRAYHSGVKLKTFSTQLRFADELEIENEYYNNSIFTKEYVEILNITM